MNMISRKITCSLIGVLMAITVWCSLITAEVTEDVAPQDKESMVIDSDYANTNALLMTKNGLVYNRGERCNPEPMPPGRNNRPPWSAMEIWNNNTILNNSIWDVATGDLNGDGYADLAVVGENHTLATYHNTHSYSFTRAFIDIDNNKNYTRVTLGDVDADGDLDIMVLTWPNPKQDPTALDLYLYVNQGGGNFAANGGVHKVDVGGNQQTFGFLFSTTLASGDFNNDGNADFVVGLSHEHPVGQTNPARASLYFLLNNGQGGYASTTATVDATDNEFGVLWIGDVLAKEATGDNFDDVIATIYGYNAYQGTLFPGEVRVYKGGNNGIVLPNTDWTYAYSQGNQMNDEWTFSVDVGEFTGDAFPDLVISTDAENQNQEWVDGKIWLAQGRQAAGFANPVEKVPVVNQGPGWDLSVYNLDDLVFDDFAVYYSMDTDADELTDKWEIRIYNTTQAGTFGLKWSDNTDQQLNGSVGLLKVDDFDHSGAGDVFYVGEDFRLINITTGFEGPDDTPPAQISDLAVSQPLGFAPDTIKLDWTAPGDDGNSEGPAAYYVIHYANFSINEANFNLSTNLTNGPQPAEPGTSESVQISLLESATTYYFAIRTVDDAKNWAPISNVVSFAIPDYIPPGKINDLAAVYIPQDGEIELTWTAPGDDIDEGTVDSYAVGFDDVNIVNFASATEISTGVPSPHVAGSPESMRIDINDTVGMNYDNTYYFAVVPSDDNDNNADLSNIVMVTLPDITPPGATLLTAEAGEDDGEIVLGWDAPGDDGNTGNADYYDIRYSLSTIEETNFGDADVVTGAPNPATPGTGHEFTVTSLTGGTKYYFALKTFDDAMNPSDMSNVAYAVATDATPPGKIKNVELTDTPDDNGGSLTLTWQISTATDFDSYRIYVSTSKISDIDPDDLVKEITDINVTLYNITKIGTEDLEDGEDYYVAIAAVDTADNQGESGLPPSEASPLDDLFPEILYYLPSKKSLKIELDSTQRFNITAEFHGDNTRNIQWYEDEVALAGETRTVLNYDAPSDVGEELEIKVELDDGTNKVEVIWDVEIVDEGAGDTGDDDDDDDDDDDTGDDDDDDDDDTGDDDDDDDTGDDDDDDTGDDDDDTGDDDLPDFITGIDLDGDDLDDGWEEHFFGDIDSNDGNDDPDNDGYSNIYEFTQDKDPTESDKKPSQSSSETDEKGMSSTLWYLIIIGGVFLLILVIVFLMIIISRRSKRKKEEEEDVVPTPVVISEKDMEAEELYGRVPAPEEEKRPVVTSFFEEEEAEGLEIEEGDMESFFSSMDEEEQPALPPVRSDEGAGIFASMRKAGEKDRPVGEERPAGEYILPEKTQGKEESLSLDALFAPIMDDELNDEDVEHITELVPARSDDFADSFLDELLTLSPYEDDDKEVLKAGEIDIPGEHKPTVEEQPMVEVECYNCGTGIPIYTDERPLIISCSNCGVQGEIE